MPENKRGTLDDSFTLNVDLAETILGAAGIKPDELMQGRDIAELYLNDGNAIEKDPWRDEFFYEFPTPQESYIPASTALVRKDWKYIKWPNHDHEELFHLKEDPLEINDVMNSPENADILNEMRMRHDELKEKYHDPTYDKNGVCDNFRKEHPEIA